MDEESQHAFMNLKERLSTAPVLPYPNFDMSFIVEADASSNAVTALLAQNKCDGHVHPVHFRKKNEDVLWEELRYVWKGGPRLYFSLQKFRIYLVSEVPLTVLTDYKSLQ